MGRLRPCQEVTHMVHAAADVPAGPASLDSVRVQFNDQRLVSDAGLLIAATLAERLGIEETVNESVWLDPRAPGAALPGRKVMTLVHGMVTGANSIDQINVLRAGSTGLILGHRVMAHRRSGRSCARSPSGTSASSTTSSMSRLGERGRLARVRAMAAGDRPGQLHRRGLRV
jgi:hypothetical protein